MTKAESILEKYLYTVESSIARAVLNAMKEIAEDAFEAGQTYADSLWWRTPFPNKEQYLENSFIKQLDND